MSIKEPIAAAVPIRRHVKLIVWLLILVSVVVSGMAYMQAQTLSGVRAYVHGESLWAKAQKEAVLQLYFYLNHPADKVYRNFERALQVNLSYQQARLALQQNPPDWNQARQGFLAAGSHPDDIDNMIRLFLWFGEVSYMQRAIGIWTAGDARIADLMELGRQIRARTDAAPNEDDRRALDQLNQDLLALELAFSTELGRGARWISTTVVMANFALLLLMLLVSGFITRKVMFDINRTEKRLRDSETRFRTLYDTDLIGIISWGNQGELFDANDAFLNTLGYSRAELAAGELNWLGLTPDHCRADDDRAMQQIAERGYCDPFQKEFFHKDGHPVTVLVGGAVMNNASDQGLAFVLDRSAQIQMENQLRLSAIVLDASLDGILICDGQRRILTANDAYCAMTGTSRELLVGTVAQFCLADNLEEMTRIDTGLVAKGSWQGDTLIARRDGKQIPVRVSVSSVSQNDGQHHHLVAVFTDISVRQALERSLKNRAHHDPLTGLANRSLLSDRVETAVVRAQRTQKSFALLFIDLDKFKPVNDALGHAVGDQVLKLVAQRLKSVVRESDTLARVGGDEFVAVVEGLDDHASAIRIAQNLIELLASPFSIDAHKIEVGCSVGISFHPDHGATTVDLMRAADMAMYQAKSQRQRRWALYQDGHDAPLDI